MLVPKIRTEVEGDLVGFSECWVVRVYGPRDVQLERHTFTDYVTALAFQLGVQAGVRAVAAARQEGE